jgi:hypothetical protein
MNNSYQNVLMNLLSLSLIMVLGRPCNLNTSLKNNSATCAALKSMAMEKKCANFVNLSTTMKMQSFPCALGKPVMKSMDILSHLCSRMGRGCNSPTGCVCSFLFSWHVGHSLTCLITSSLRPFHENLSLTCLYVLPMP